MNNKKIINIDDMIKTLIKAKNKIGGDSPIMVATDHGILNLIVDTNVVIAGGVGIDNNVWGNSLVINAGDWDSPDKKAMNIF